jgi:hypothetical protein
MHVIESLTDDMETWKINKIAKKGRVRSPNIITRFIVITYINSLRVGF